MPLSESLFQCALEAFGNRRIPRTLTLLRAAELAGHDPGACSAYRWFCRMLEGRFEDAWRESDAIAARGKPDPHRLWDGRPFTGRKVVIRCLHGYGDAIQFIRYARRVREAAARVTIQTHPELVSLMQGMPFADQVVTWTGSSYEWDQQIEVMELPLAFRTTIQTIPNETPYLFVGAQRRANCRIAAAPHERFRIGLQWGSGEWDQGRSMGLDVLRPILEIPEVEFYSFQRGARRAELQALPAGFRIHDVSGDSAEIVEAAADLLNVDLLITVDTMLAHLAGALGKPVWVLLPFAADWRWMLARSDSPWYPGMRLFRQPASGDWPAVVCKVVAGLPELIHLQTCESPGRTHVHGCHQAIR